MSVPRAFGLVVLFSIAWLVAALAAAERRGPGPAELVAPELGPVIVVQEGAWQGRWTRRPGSNVLDAEWSDKEGRTLRDVVQIVSRDGARVVLMRRSHRGRYIGELSPDGKTISGTASWYPKGATWSGRVCREGSCPGLPVVGGTRDLYGTWELQRGGGAAGAEEPPATLVLGADKDRIEAKLQLESGGPWYKLSAVSFADGVLRFTRPAYRTGEVREDYQGVLQDGRLSGTFRREKLQYAWRAEKRK